MENLSREEASADVIVELLPDLIDVLVRSQKTRISNLLAQEGLTILQRQCLETTQQEYWFVCHEAKYFVPRDRNLSALEEYKHKVFGQEHRGKRSRELHQASCKAIEQAISDIQNLIIELDKNGQ